MTSRTRALGVFVGLVLLLGTVAHADDYDTVVGIWQVTTKVGSENNESMLTLRVEDGELKGSAGNQQGSIPAQDLAFSEGTLSWSISLRGQKMPIEVKVDGDTFEGALKSPLGSLPVTGKRVTEEDLAAQENALEGLVGDWELFSEYDGNTIESKMRIMIDEDDGDLEGWIISPGTRVMVRRIELDGENLRMVIGFPLVSDRPGFLNAKLVDNAFEGVVKSALGDIPVRGALVDTTKLVVAPYDDPAAILGTWDFVAHVNGEDHPGTIEFFEDGPFLKAHVETEGGLDLDAESVDYKQVGDTMGVIRFNLNIPDLGPDEQIMELIVSGNSFEGEELHSNGAFYMEGAKQG